MSQIKNERHPGESRDPGFNMLLKKVYDLDPGFRRDDVIFMNLKLNQLFFKSFLTLFVLAFVLSGCGGSRSRLKVGKTDGGEVVEAEGLAPHKADDIIATKRASLTDAQRNALEKVVGVYLSAKTLVEKAVAIENNILSKTSGYIKKFDILKEWVEDDLYKTRIRALVALRDLASDLEAMDLLRTPDLEKPRLYINIVEQVGRDYVDEKPASRGLEETLLAQGFKIVSKERAKEADLVMEGKGSSFPFQSKGLGGFVSYRARLILQVRLPGTKDIIYSTQKEASGFGGSKELAGLKALETVGKLAGDQIAEPLAQAWAKGKNLLVMVEGVDSFDKVDRIKKHLEAQPGIEDLVLRFYQEEMAQFEIRLDKLKPEELASHLQNSKTIKLKVLETTPQTLRLRVR